MIKTKMAVAATAASYAWGSWLFLVLDVYGAWPYLSTCGLIAGAVALWLNAADELCSAK